MLRLPLWKTRKILKALLPDHEHAIPVRVLSTLGYRNVLMQTSSLYFVSTNLTIAEFWQVTTDVYSRRDSTRIHG